MMEPHYKEGAGEADLEEIFSIKSKIIALEGRVSRLEQELVRLKSNGLSEANVTGINPSNKKNYYSHRTPKQIFELFED